MLFWKICHHKLRIHYIVRISRIPTTCNIFRFANIFHAIFPLLLHHSQHIIQSLLAQYFFMLQNSPDKPPPIYGAYYKSRYVVVTSVMRSVSPPVAPRPPPAVKLIGGSLTAMFLLFHLTEFSFHFDDLKKTECKCLTYRDAKYSELFG